MSGKHEICGINYLLHGREEEGCAEYMEWLGQKENLAKKGWAIGAGTFMIV
ncbi:MAG: hypothetical protein HDR11_11695 [Lachnospiraceae bacterium]|nr:hypothetical protein [Lachnospiraceae bacterium]